MLAPLHFNVTSTRLPLLGIFSQPLSLFFSAGNPQVRRDDFKQYELLKDEVAYRVADRVYDIKRNFAKGLDVGCGRGHLGKVGGRTCRER